MPQRIEFESRDVDNFFNKSGAAMNHSKSSTPRCRTPTGTTMGSLHIDLYNMEDPKFENSKYVLTSPRSLEACAHLNMKPVELLYKPLIDFQEELVPEGYSIRAIYETYDQHERERQNKLQLCREERSQIADEDNRLGRPCSAPVITKSKSPIRDRTVTLVSKSSTREQQIESSVTPGSLQRARTAWNTSIGHTRVTQEELKERAEELNAKNQQLKKSHPKISKKSFKPPIKKSVKVVATKQTLTPRLKKKQEREQKQQGSRESISDGSSNHTSGSGGSRTARPWIKDPCADAKPIADPQLRRKLNGITDCTRLSTRSRTANLNRHSAPVMSSQDQKILKMMLEKREQEKSVRDLRETNKLKREEEQMREKARKNASENQRRLSLEKSSHQRDAQKQFPRRSYSSPNGFSCNHGDSCNCGRDHNRKRIIEARQRKKTEDDSAKKEREKALAQCQKDHTLALQKQLELKRQMVHDKKLKELERRKSVEDRLEMQRREMEEYNEQIRRKQQNELERAHSMKMTKEQQVAMRTKMKNYQARRKHEEKMNEIKRKSCEDLQSLRSSLDAKLTSAQIKHKSQMQQKEQELRKSKLEYDKKIRETKENQRKLEEEMLGWQTELLSYRKMQEQRAEEAAKDQVAKRKQKILEDRILRGKLQRENLEKLLSQDEDYRAELEASLAMKEARANALIAERDRIIQDSRAMSAASQRLRDEVRHHFSMNDLDQLNKQALMEARLGVRGSQTSLANQRSRVTLG